MSSMGYPIIGETFQLLYFVHQSNFRYLLRGYMLLLKKLEEDTEEKDSEDDIDFSGNNGK